MNFFGKIFSEPVPTLSLPELQEKMQNGKPPFLLDVREPEEFRHGHIARAKLIPLGELGDRIKELPREREIVCVCASGNRSLSAARILKGAGYSASSLSNGMTGWQMANLPIHRGM
jgi:rhodanese-related sulfurtransferase